MNETDLMPKKNLKNIEITTHRKVAGEFLNHDTCRGRKDGRRAPDAYPYSLQAVEAEEMKAKNEARSALQQTAADASSHLEHIDNLIAQNDKDFETLKAQGSMIPESAAAAQHSSASRNGFIALVLTFLDAVGIITILKFIFGGHTLLIVPLGLLLVAAVVFGIKNLLERLSPEKRAFAGKLLVISGCVLVLVGLMGFALLRSQTFNTTISSTDMIDMSQISMGNLLFTIGVGLGLPLVLGVWYESENTKREFAEIPLRFYTQEKQLKKAKAEWLSLLKQVQVLNDGLDDITGDIIRLRSGRYMQGYVSGVMKNKDAGNYIAAIRKYVENVISEKTLNGKGGK